MKNIHEYCEFVFGFKKSFTYNLLNVASKFSNGFRGGKLNGNNKAKRGGGE